MRVSRVYVAEPIAGRRTCELSGTAANHVLRVLRLRAGEPLTLFDGTGGEYAATMDKSSKGRVTVSVGEHSAVERESTVAITLVQGVSRSERMDLVVQKATELGVTHIVPITTERTVVRIGAPQADRKFEHWRAIAIAACEQCGRNRLPELRAPISLQSWLEGRQPAAISLVLSTRASIRLGAALRAARNMDLLIGPEGGLTADEESAALAAGYRSVSLGPRVLRTETAAIAALAAIQYAVGDF
jgi:16S rRNA (uracil1498-N3)-methyltransferase